MTNSKNNEKPDEIIHANLTLRSRTKKSIFEREEGKKRNFKNFEPPEGAFESVSKVLTEMGFKVIGKGRFSLIISSSRKHFEEIFKVQLKRSRYALFTGSTRPRAKYFLPTKEIKIPEVLIDFVEKVTFSPPFRYFQSEVPPNPNYHHLNVPDQIAELLRANIPHNLGYTGRGVHVVMIDTGFYNHSYYSDKGYSIDVESIDGNTAEDNEGHGTAIAANLFAVAPEIDFTMIKAIS